MNAHCDVAVIGAGPYGLSVAAHLLAAGIDTRVIGNPMSAWKEHMPVGMYLKSVGSALNLYEPSGGFTLARYCEEHGIPYHDTIIPVLLDTFVSYADAFRKRFVPNIDEVQVSSVDAFGDAFQLSLSDGTSLTARRVILAVGISHFAFVPPQIAHLPSDFLTHSSAHRNVDQFRDARVAIVGGGASAMDLAALLTDAGAAVTVIARRAEISFVSQRAADEGSWMARIRRPSSTLGTGWKLRFFAEAPELFHYLPERTRLRIVRNHLGPAAGWTVRDRVDGHVRLLLSHQTRAADVQNGEVRLVIAGPDGAEKTLAVEHVIAASGYRADLRRLLFLSEDIRDRLRSINHTPILSSTFQSSVPGLYFVGSAAANSFGPLLRFVCGAQFTSRVLTAHIARTGLDRFLPRRVLISAAGRSFSAAARMSSSSSPK